MKVRRSCVGRIERCAAFSEWGDVVEGEAERVWPAELEWNDATAEADVAVAFEDDGFELASAPFAAWVHRVTSRWGR